MNKIMAIDNDDGIRLLYEEELTYEGYKVITASGSDDIMGLIEQKRPNLVVLGIMLGSRNGLDLLMDIRNAYYDMPVILCTAYAEFRDDLRSIAADYYVIKSSDLSELKFRIKLAIESTAGLQKELPSGNPMEAAILTELMSSSCHMPLQWPGA